MRLSLSLLSKQSRECHQANRVRPSLSFRRRWVVARLERTNNCVVRWFNKLQVPPAFTTLLIFYFTELFLISDYRDTLALYARLTLASEESLDFSRNFVRKMKYKNGHPLWWHLVHEMCTFRFVLFSSVLSKSFIRNMWLCVYELEIGRQMLFHSVQVFFRDGRGKFINRGTLQIISFSVPDFRREGWGLSDFFKFGPWKISIFFKLLLCVGIHTTNIRAFFKVFKRFTIFIKSVGH